MDDFEQDLTNLRSSPAKTVTSSDSQVTPQLGAVYSLNDEFSVYASYGEGFRQQAGSDFRGSQFDPNPTESSEIGFKFEGAVTDQVSGSVSLALLMLTKVISL